MMGRVYEQIPHPKINYAYLAIEADTWNEFEKLRSEALKRHPLYKASAFEQPSPGAVVVPTETAEAPTASADGEASTTSTPGADDTSKPVSAEGLSPRDKAKAALAAKKGA
jgi:hypothetical protein